MKKMIDNKAWGHVHHVLKTVVMLLVGLSIIYSFLYVPFSAKQIRKNCNVSALNQAQSTALDVQRYNANLAEGQEPIQLDQVGLYSTQYNLCLQSEGL